MLDDTYYESQGSPQPDGSSHLSSSQSSSASSSESSSCSDPDDEMRSPLVALAAEGGATMPMRNREGTLREILCRKRFELSRDLRWTENEDVHMLEVKIERRHRQTAAAATVHADASAVGATRGTKQVASSSSASPCSPTASARSTRCQS